MKERNNLVLLSLLDTNTGEQCPFMVADSSCYIAVKFVSYCFTRLVMKSSRFLFALEPVLDCEFSDYVTLSSFRFSYFCDKSSRVICLAVNSRRLPLPVFGVVAAALAHFDFRNKLIKVDSDYVFPVFKDV